MLLERHGIVTREAAALEQLHPREAAQIAKAVQWVGCAWTTAFTSGRAARMSRWKRHSDEGRRAPS